MKTGWFLTLSLVPLTAIADPVADLAQALQNLHNHTSYAWETTIVPAQISMWKSEMTFQDPTTTNGTRTETQIVPAPIYGVTDRAQGTLIRASLGRTDATAGQRMKAIIRDGGGVVEAPGGWRDAAEIERDLRPLLPAPGDRHTIMTTDTYPLMIGRLELSLRAPADELAMLLADAQPAMQANSAVVVTLSDATAKQFIFDLRFRDGAHPAEAPPSAAEGRITFRLKKGEIVKYEVTIDADVHQERGPERPIHFVKTTFLRDFDNARVEIPTKALARLDAAEAVRPPGKSD